MSLEIAISGISILSSLGEGVEPFLNDSKQKKEINHKIDPALFADALDSVDKGPYELYRIQKLCAAVFIKALSISGIDISKQDASRIAVILGNSYGIEEFKAEFFKKYKSSLPPVSPSLFVYTTANSIAAWLAIQFGIKGVNLTFTNGCIAGSEAILAGCDCIASGKADTAIVVGVNLIYDDFKDSFYKSGFRQEALGALVLEKKENVVNSDRKVLAFIEDFKHGFLFENDIQKLNNLEIPIELQSNGTENIIIHLGNSLAEDKFTCNNDIRHRRGRNNGKLFSLNSIAGNVFSASGILGVALSKHLLGDNINKSLFIDVDSYGGYVKFNVRI